MSFHDAEKEKQQIVLRITLQTKNLQFMSLSFVIANMVALKLVAQLYL